MVGGLVLLVPTSAVAFAKVGIVKYMNGNPYCQFNDGSIIFAPFSATHLMNGGSSCQALAIPSGGITRYYLDLQSDGAVRTDDLSGPAGTTFRELRSHGLQFPGVRETAPLPSYAALSVNGRPFAFLAAAEREFSLSVRLPQSRETALRLPYARPAGYGLARSGWVTFTASRENVPSGEQLRMWLEESYRAQAPRRLLREFDLRHNSSN